MRVAVYVRVSTRQQAESQTIEQQLERLRAHIQAQGWTLSDESIFRDDGYSGAALNRPGLDRLRDQATARAFDCVLIFAPDRLARNYVHQVLLIEELERAGCQVQFLDRPMSHDPHDQLLLQIRGAVAEYERTLITERMRRGRLSKFRAGVLLPWTRPPYGYRLHPERPRDPNGVRLEPAAAAFVAEIFSAYLQDGASLIRVAKALFDQHLVSPTGKKRWGLATLRGILTNPAYTGQVYAGRMRYHPPKVRRSATHPMGRPHDSATLVPREEWIPVAAIPAIVTQEQFDQVQDKLARNKSFASRHNTAHHYLLRALVSCGVCQLACLARTVAGQSYGYYVCTGKAKPVQARREEKCPSRFIPVKQLDELVWNDLCDLLTQPHLIAQAMERALGGSWLPQELQARRENLRRGRSHLEQQLNRLTEAYLNEIIPLAEYQRRRQELEQRVQALANQTNQLLAQVDRQKELTGLVAHVDDFCQRVQTGLVTATFDQKRQLVELLVDRVVVTDAEVEIRYVVPIDHNGEHTRFCHLRTDYFGDPNLVRPRNQDALHQVGIAWQVVVAVGRSPRFALDSGLQTHLAHQARHSLTVDIPVTPLQFGGHPPIAIGRELPGHFADRRFECLIIRRLRLIVECAA
jgi:site-specific DNA recombinase